LKRCKSKEEIRGALSGAGGEESRGGRGSRGRKKRLHLLLG